MSVVMKEIILIKWMVFLLLFSFQALAQSNSTLPVFPRDWLGSWIGELEIYQGQTIVQKVKMKVENTMTDSLDVFIWALIYGDDMVQGRRDYRLKPRDKSKGLWYTDEQNSIQLEGKVVANTYISVFEVSGNILTSKMTMLDHDVMEFEILVFRKDQYQQSGGTVHEGEEIPIVYSYPVTGYQRALLTKEQ